MFVYIFSGCEQQREYLQQQQHQLGGGGHEAVAMASRGGCVIQTNTSASSNCGSANCGSLNRRHHPIGSDQVARNSSTLTRRSAAAGASTASSSHIHHHVTASGTLNRCPNSAEASLLRRSSSTSNRYFFDGTILQQFYWPIDIFLADNNSTPYRGRCVSRTLCWPHPWRHQKLTAFWTLPCLYLNLLQPSAINLWRRHCKEVSNNPWGRNWDCNPWPLMKKL